MKKRRTLVIAILLIAALALGIGYAAQSGFVKVSGDVANKPHELKLVFVNKNVGDAVISDSKIGTGSAEETTSTLNVLSVVDGEVNANFDVSDLAHKDDYITAILTVKNTNQYDVIVREEPTVSYNWSKGSGFFEVEGVWVDAQGAKITTEEGRTLSHEETLKLKVTITMTAEATGDELLGDFSLQAWADSKTTTTPNP